MMLLVLRATGNDPNESILSLPCVWKASFMLTPYVRISGIVYNNNVTRENRGHGVTGMAYKLRRSGEVSDCLNISVYIDHD